METILSPRLVTTGHYRSLLPTTAHYCPLLPTTGHYCPRLPTTAHYQSLLSTTTHYSTSHYQSLPGHYCPLLWSLPRVVPTTKQRRGQNLEGPKWHAANRTGWASHRSTLRFCSPARFSGIRRDTRLSPQTLLTTRLLFRRDIMHLTMVSSVWPNL